MQGLNFGALDLRLDDSETGIQIKFPPIYGAFQPSTALTSFHNPSSEYPQMPEATDSMVIYMQEQTIPASFNFALLINDGLIWQLRHNSDNEYIFNRSLDHDGYCLVVNSEFTQGQIIGEHLTTIAASQYLLASLDLPLFVNWLGKFGDLILHASCVVVNGKGYCFPGPSGAGKSTLAAYLADQHSLTVLGEDHIILRYLDGQFWVFGSPWHENPALCAPVGVPLEKLIFLDRDVTQGINTISPLDGVARILQTAFIPYYRPEITSQILARLSTLAEQVPFFTLNYPLGTDPLDLILDGFS